MDKLIQERIQKLVQDTDLFEYHNVTLGNMRIIDRGAPPYCVIYPGGFDQPRLQFSGNTLHQPVWTYPVDIVERFLDDDYTPIVDARQVFMDQMNFFLNAYGINSGCSNCSTCIHAYKTGKR